MATVSQLPVSTARSATMPQTSAPQRGADVQPQAGQASSPPALDGPGKTPNAAAQPFGGICLLAGGLLTLCCLGVAGIAIAGAKVMHLGGKAIHWLASGGGEAAARSFERRAPLAQPQRMPVPTEDLLNS